MSVASVIDEAVDASLDDLLAVFDEMDAREAMSERERLLALGAPAHLAFDLSDAAHDCVSDDNGTCASCAGGGTPALPTHYNRAKYL